MTCWYHCRINLGRAGRNLVLNKPNKCIEVLQNDREHLNFLQVLAIYHIASNAFYLQNSLGISRPHCRNSNTRIKNEKKKVLVWPCTIFFSAHRKVVWLFEVLVGNVQALIHFNQLDKRIYLLLYQPGYTNLSDIDQGHQWLGTSHIIQKSDI